MSKILKFCLKCDKLVIQVHLNNLCLIRINRYHRLNYIVFNKHTNYTQCNNNNDND